MRAYARACEGWGLLPREAFPPFQAGGVGSLLSHCCYGFCFLRFLANAAVRSPIVNHVLEGDTSRDRTADALRAYAAVIMDSASKYCHQGEFLTDC